MKYTEEEIEELAERAKLNHESNAKGDDWHIVFTKSVLANLKEEG